MGLFYKQGSWWIDYYYQGKRKRKKIGTSRKLAETVLQKIKVQIAEKKYLDIEEEPPKILFRDFATTYEQYARANRGSWQKESYKLRNLVYAFGDTELHKITPMQIEQFKIQRLTDVKSASVNRELSLLRHMLNKAVAWGKIKESPFHSVKLLKEENQRLRFLSWEEIHRLLGVCPEYLKPIVIVALNTGLRKGHILRLRWDQIDFNNRLILLERTKSGKRLEIPMSDLLTKTLKQIKQETENVFQFKDIKKSFKTALRKAGIKNFRFHDLRHTFASHLVMSGEDLTTVKELLGHKTIAMTLRYAHLAPEHKRKAVERLGHLLDT